MPQVVIENTEFVENIRVYSGVHLLLRCDDFVPQRSFGYDFAEQDFATIFGFELPLYDADLDPAVPVQFTTDQELMVRSYCCGLAQSDMNING